jgi:peptidyl-prolyl cis-trans isomerase SurA
MRSVAVAVALVCAASSARADRPPAGATATIDRPVALVDRTPIWASEIEDAAKRQAHAAGMLAPTAELIANALDEAIANVLYQREAARIFLTVSDSEVDDAVTMIKKSNKIDDAAFDKALADALFTRATYREELRQQLLQQRLLFRIVVPKIVVSDDDVTREYDKRKLDKHDLPKLDPPLREVIKNELREKKLEAGRHAWVLDLQRHSHIERRL